MSKPLTADELVQAFREWEVPVKQMTGWRGHNRNSKGAWGPVHGLILHHTGDDSPDDRSATMLFNGRSDLPGPLCSWGMQDDGTAVMIGNGRANHAGMGSGAILDDVIGENYGDVDLHPGPDTTDGNAHFYGQETMYSGGHPMSIWAYRNTVRAFAAVCDRHGWSAKSAIGHKEWTRRKVDPGNLSMRKFRKDVDAALAAGPGNWPVKETRLRPEVTAMRERLKTWTRKRRRASVRRAAIAFDQQLARIERR